MKIKAWFAAIFSAAVLSLAGTPARAATLQCDQLSGGMGLCIPRYGTAGDQWGRAIINAFTTINSSAILNGSIVGASSGSFFVGISTANYIPWLVTQGNNSNSIFIGNMERTDNPVGLIFSSSRTASGGRLGSVWQYYGNTPVARIDFNKNVTDKNSGSIDFLTYNQGTVASRLTILSTGAVVIGGTGAPSGASILRMNSSNNYMVLQATAAASLSQGQLAYGSADPAMPGTAVLTWTDAARIGIRTSTPTATLEIKSGTANTALIVNQLRSGENSVQFVSPNVAGASSGVSIRAGTNSSDAALILENAGGTEQTRFRGDGFVGFGTASPASRLHVEGTGATALSATSNLNIYTASVTAGGYNVSAYGGNLGAPFNVSGAGWFTKAPVPLYLGANADARFPSISISTIGVAAPTGGNVGINLPPERICSTCTLHVNGGISALTLAGDGSGITNVGGFAALGATQTWTGANTFTSTFTFRQLNTPSGVANQGLIYFSTSNVFMVVENNGTPKPIVDPPGNWTCTSRTGTCATNQCTATATCSGNEKALSGGCGCPSGACGATANDRPTAQGWECIYASNGSNTVTAYANCCL